MSSDSRKKPDQESLRQMMREIKKKSGSEEDAGNSRLKKKYKISKKEEELIRLQKSEKLTSESSLPKGFFDAKPAKSILKNSSSYVIPSQPYFKANPQLKTPSGGTVAHINDELPEDDEPSEESKEDNKELPEGFFDDPIKDAKARHVEYKDPSDVEWEKFKKEISKEIDVAQEIAAEDQAEATNDRQLDEIEDQMKAWGRVAKMEKERDVIEKEWHEKMNKIPEETNASDESEEEFDEFFNWRNKCT